MAIRLRIARTFWTRPLGRVFLIALLLLALVGAGAFAYAWYYFSQMIEARLSGEIFEHASQIYAAPTMLEPGEEATASALAAQLKRFGYREVDEGFSAYGSYRLLERGIEVRPGRASLVGPAHAVQITFRQNQVDGIISLRDNRERDFARLDPERITNLFDSRRRAKRRLVQYEEIPPHLIQAVIAAEDRRFFDHFGISFIDGLRALWVDIRAGARVQGASTITMQLARSFFLTPSRTFKRKAAEAIIAVQLERRFSKQKILEMYANEIYLGNRGSFVIHGFGEAAQAYFDKDITQLTLPESALLAGMIRGPSRYNPFRHPDRALLRRNHVLGGMIETGALTPPRAHRAMQAPLEPAAADVEATEAPYFVDYVRDQLLDRYSEEELISHSYRIYSTLDRRLQHAAARAVDVALPEVDALLEERFERLGLDDPPSVQVALVALDPRTGDIKALVGGRDYTRSQLNRAVASRQPGSGFKPFVYAAAFATALDELPGAITPVTTLVDEPTAFEWEGELYEPSNFGEKFYGVVTVREALIRSLNVATVKVAQRTGYERVAEIARAAGFDSRLKATPAIALGSYSATPIDVAGAYTIFPNLGRRVDPGAITHVLDAEGQVLEHASVEPEEVLDPRVAYLVVDLLRDNLNRGTGYAARARGFTAPAAGKTGTSRDAWFIGFTTNLLCAVWVGFDDYRDLGFPGSRAALPIWTAFMKQAVAHYPYSQADTFTPPEGIVAVPLDPQTLQIATPECPDVRTEIFIEGTEPKQMCPKHRVSLVRRVTRSISRGVGALVGDQDDEQPPEQPGRAAPAGEWHAPHNRPGLEEDSSSDSASRVRGQPPEKDEKQKEAKKEEKEKSKGIFKRILGIFGGGDDDEEEEAQAKSPAPADDSEQGEENKEKKDKKEKDEQDE